MTDTNDTSLTSPVASPDVTTPADPSTAAPMGSAPAANAPWAPQQAQTASGDDANAAAAPAAMPEQPSMCGMNPGAPMGTTEEMPTADANAAPATETPSTDSTNQ